jgi:ABC-2 type transport system permease protein
MIIGYLQVYFILVIPTYFFLWGIVFAVVTITRKHFWLVSTVILLLFVQSMVSSFTNDTDNQYIAGLLDPLVARHYLIIPNIDCCRKKHKLAPV